MLLHEAMRLGASLRPQCRKYLANGNDETCALGAAYEAVGVTLDELRAFAFTPALAPKKALAAFPHLIDLSVSKANHPVDGDSVEVHSVIVSLNDEHDWTREKIATWLQPIEEAYLAQQHDAHVEAVKARLLEAEAPVAQEAL